MDILIRRGRATGAGDGGFAGTAESSTVTQLRVLERKGHVRHEEQGAKFIYLLAGPRRRRVSRLCAIRRHLLRRTAENVVGALLGGEGVRVTEEDESDRGTGEGSRRSTENPYDVLRHIAESASVVIIAGLAAAGALQRRSAATRHARSSPSIVCAPALQSQRRAGVAMAAAALAAVDRPGPDRPSAARAPRDGVAASKCPACHRPSSQRTGGVMSAFAPAWPAAAVSLLVLLIGVARLAWLASASALYRDRPMDGDCRRHRTRARLRRVRLLESDHPSLLVTCGVWWTPKAILPVVARAPGRTIA